jgi:hypothetical protein
MAGIGAGPELLAEMDQALVHLENDTASRADFLDELDARVAAAVPAGGWGPGDTTGPLLQAGAWLACTNLVARAVVAEQDGEAARALLRRPEVARYFLGYVRSEEGAQKAGITSARVAETLLALERATEDPDLDDARTVAAATDELLGLL